MHLSKSLLPILTLLAVSFCAPAVIAETLEIYGTRKAAMLAPIFARFSQVTGVGIHYHEYKKSDALMSDLLSGQASPSPDLLITSDVGMMNEWEQNGLLLSIDSPILNALIDQSYYDLHHSWYGLSLRARPIFVSTRHDLKPPKNYADLADPQYAGQICMRELNHPYNRTLIAALYFRWGKDLTTQWIEGIRSNLARPPEGGDRDQLRAVASGECDITLANTYYYANMLNSDHNEDRLAAHKVRLIWPEGISGGVHINISIGAVLQSTEQPELTQRFLEFVSKPEGQRIFTAINHEYPIVTGVPVSATLGQLGAFKRDNIHLHHVGDMYDEVGDLLQMRNTSHVK